MTLVSHLLAMWPQSRSLTSLSLDFPGCKMRTNNGTIHKVVMGSEYSHSFKVFSIVSGPYVFNSYYYFFKSLINPSPAPQVDLCGFGPDVSQPHCPSVIQSWHEGDMRQLLSETY